MIRELLLYIPILVMTFVFALHYDVGIVSTAILATVISLVWVLVRLIWKAGEIQESE